MRFHAVPAGRCFCPAKTFSRVLDAYRYARQAAAGFRTEYAVWHVRQGRLRLLRRFAPAPTRRATPCGD